MLVFWTKVEWSIRGVRNTVQRLFSGVIFPLYLLPAGLSNIFDVLPFKYMVDGPIQIFLMQITGFEAFKMLGLQFAWVLVLFGLARYIWKKARTKMTVQGG
jgi:ABC-2 type transport system permease protein